MLLARGERERESECVKKDLISVVSETLKPIRRFVTDVVFQVVCSSASRVTRRSGGGAGDQWSEKVVKLRPKPNGMSGSPV